MSTPEPGWPLRRIVVLPLVLFVVVSAGVFTLAKLHLAKPAASAGAVKLGDVKHGRVVYVQKCAPCHGMQAQGKVGPRLAGVHLTVEAAKAQIDSGSGIMPAGLVSGADEADVLAYLQTLLTGGGS